MTHYKICKCCGHKQNARTYWKKLIDTAEDTKDFRKIDKRVLLEMIMICYEKNATIKS